MSMVQCSFCVGRGWSSLFRHVEAIQEIDEGYAFKFPRSNRLIRRIVDYAAFESRHGSPHTFTLRVGSRDGDVWFQVRGPAGEKERIRALYVSVRSNQQSCGRLPTSYFCR
jgi:hypothetical protein